MEKAFDSILGIVVSAADADPEEKYRYSCLCCQELVFVASPEQKVQVVHFRHRRGNNGIEDCENYVQQPGQSLTPPKNRGDNISFYYDEENQLFSFSITLGEDEIREHEKNNDYLELRTSYTGAPILRVPIDFTHFSADFPERFPISEYSDNYYILLSSGETKRCHKLFSSSSPVFFKVLEDAGTYITAKQIRGGCLYTETLYFAVYSSGQADRLLIKNADVIRHQKFHTMGHTFNGYVLQFKEKNPDVDYYLNSINCHLETFETLRILWPPMIQEGAVLLSGSTEIYISSSFQLRPKGNTNALSSEIEQYSGSVSRIMRAEEIRIHFKNAEAIIRHASTSSTIKTLQIEEQVERRFEIPDSKGWWILHRQDAKALNCGMQIALCPGDRIVEYLRTYPTRCIVRQPDILLSGQALLDDILKNYKIDVPYEGEFIGNNISDIAAKYLAQCKDRGVINQKVRELIGSGVI